MIHFIQIKNIAAARAGTLVGADTCDAASACELAQEDIIDGMHLPATFEANVDGIKCAWVMSPRSGYDCIVYPIFFDIVLTKPNK